MPWRFDSPVDGSNFIFDHVFQTNRLGLVFDSPVDGAAFTFDQQNNEGIHSAPSVITLLDNSTHEYIGIYEHGLFANYDIYSAGTHEYVLAPEAPGYLHNSPSSITLISQGSHEYISAVTVYVQAQLAGEGIVSLSDSGTHIYFEGGSGYIHAGTSSITLSDSGTHNFLASTFIALSQNVFSYVERWLDSTPSSFVVNFSDLASSVGRVTFLLDSDGDLYVSDVGPGGGSVSVAVEAIVDGEVLSIVSLSKQYPRATVFDYPGQDTFSKMAAAMASGPVTFRIGGYEGLDDRSLPLRLPGEATLTVEAVVTQ